MLENGWRSFFSKKVIRQADFSVDIDIETYRNKARFDRQLYFACQLNFSTKSFSGVYSLRKLR